MNLWELVETGDQTGLRQAIAEGADPNRSFPDSDECLLTIAASRGDSAMVRLLLELRADPNFCQTVTPPLTAAVESGSLTSVKELLKAGAEINVRDEDGGTPLMIAAACGHVDIVKELLQRGANPKLKDESANTALFLATDKNHIEVCELLMPISTAKERERAKLVLAFRSQGETSEEVNQLILAATRGHAEVVYGLVRNGLSVNAINEDGKTALMRAANKNHKEIVEWMLERGADINRRDIYGESPLTYAAMGCHPEMYDFLFPLTDKKLRKRAEMIKKNQIDIGNWPAQKG
ncbi:MAG: ankyrin repeat domain-containing protein [Bythopirellula sp.]|nr:ankyrin repeat domain-containing protein [Bythopirellula sp.]